MATKINNIIVKPIPGKGVTHPFVRGSNMFDKPYANIAIIGGKGHGKTTIEYNILENCAYKSDIVIFSPTLFNDSSFDQMNKMLKAKKCNVISYPHFLDSDSKLNLLQEIIDNKIDEARILKEQEELYLENQKCNKGEKIDSDPFGYKSLCANLSTNLVVDNGKGIKPVKEKVPTKNKPLTPEMFFVFDDLGTDMRNPSILKLLLKNRHFKCKTIMCIHNACDIEPGSFQNLDYIICLKDMPRKKLDEIQAKIGIEYTDVNYLWDMYNRATEKPYNFLYIDRDKPDKLRRNFNEVLK